MKWSPKFKFILAAIGIAMIIVNGRISYYVFGGHIKVEHTVSILLLGLLLLLPTLHYIWTKRKNEK